MIAPITSFVLVIGDDVMNCNVFVSGAGRHPRHDVSAFRSGKPMCDVVEVSHARQRLARAIAAAC